MKKIVTIGPESTGKSTLCEQLAQHYDSMWCPEFAREYLLTNGKNYDYDDLLTSQRTNAQVNLAYLIALREIKVAEAEIDGLLLTGSLYEAD